MIAPASPLLSGFAAFDVLDMLRADALEPEQRFASRLAILAIAMAVGTATGLALLSLRWPLVHDLPIFLYDGFLMKDLGQVPYRDFYEINAPGTLLFYAALHQWTQGASLPLRLIDLGVLAAISGVTILALQPTHGSRAGLLAASCFAITYLSRGPIHSLQREYLSVLPLAISVALLFRTPSFVSGWRALAATGLLAGLVVPVKPVLALCWFPFPMIALIARLRASAERPRAGRLLWTGAQVAVPFVLGLGVVPLVAVLWLARHGALDDYVEIARNYYPLYSELRGNATMWQGSALEAVQRYLANPLELIPSFPFAVLAFMGLAAAWTYRARLAFAQCLAICLLVLCATAYVAVTGKFWAYHRFPLFYGLSLLAGLALSRELTRGPHGSSAWWAAIVCAAVAVGLPLNVAGRELAEWSQGKASVVKEGRVDLVEGYLRQHVQPGETVLPLDVTSGVVHAMYRDRRPLYGRFVYDVHFYHHPRHPYIQRLRRELLDEFRDGEPDVVIRADDTWLRTPDFPQLDAVLSRDYELVLQQNQVSILRRRPVTPQPRTAGQ